MGHRLRTHAGGQGVSGPGHDQRGRKTTCTAGPDLDDTIARLQAYQEAGADVLYAPGLTTRAQIAAATTSVDRPVNVVVGLPGTQFPVADLGVKRIGVGSALFGKAFSVAMAADRRCNRSRP